LGAAAHQGSSGVKPRQGEAVAVAGWCSAEGHVKAPGVGVNLQSGFLVAIRGGKRQQQRRCALPIGRTWSRAGGSACSFSFPHAAMELGTRPSMPRVAILPLLPISQVSPPSPLLLRWEVLGKKSPGGGGQGKSKGRPGFYTGGLGLGEATDGVDLRHPCPWPRGTHLAAGRAARQGGAAGLCSVWEGCARSKGGERGIVPGCRVGPAGHREEEKIEKGKGAGWACWADFGFRGPHT
jgi:hypothetical protein